MKPFMRKLNFILLFCDVKFQSIQKQLALFSFFILISLNKPFAALF
jgi:hypothetical protein